MDGARPSYCHHEARIRLLVRFTRRKGVVPVYQ